MKKIIILMFALLSCKCGDKEIVKKNSPMPYKFGFEILLSRIRDPEVKYVKIAVRNTDKIIPKYKVFLTHDVHRNTHYDKATDTYFGTEQRKLRTSYGGETYYFGGLAVRFGDLGDYVLNKDRTFELKIYKNDALFLTKKITMRSGVDPVLKYWWSEDDPDNLTFSGYTDKVEVDNMDHVKEINVGDRQGRALVIEIPDKPIKK